MIKILIIIFLIIQILILFIKIELLILYLVNYIKIYGNH
jgi:hypothetical protein